MKKKNILIVSSLLIILILALIFIRLEYVNNSADYQMEMLKRGNVKEKIAAADFMKKNKISEAVPLLINNIYPAEEISYKNGSRRISSCSYVQALEQITEAGLYNADVCHERISKSNDSVKNVEKSWQNWYQNQQYPDWQLYRNTELGFEIKYPEKAMFWNAICESKDNGYQTLFGLAPVKIVEGKNFIHISNEYSYEATTEGCKKNDNSLGLLEDEDSWKIIIKDNINSDEELSKFLKEFYVGFGGNCSLGEKKPASQKNVYDIYTNYDGKNLEESECFINGWSVVKYYPEKGKIAAWLIAQEPVFWADSEGKFTFDEEMVKSFRFID